MMAIDIVIPWVDSSDNKWIEKRNLYLQEADLQMNDTSEERFRDYGTLKFVLRSIEKYASWVHHVYLITDEQIPEWLNSKASKITVVDHKEIIPAEKLPIFNSNVIEQNIINIPGLADKFIVFNDDTLINKYVGPADFFKNNVPRDFRVYKAMEPVSDFDQIPFNDIRLINQWLDGRWPLNYKGIFNVKYGRVQMRNILRLRSHKVSGYIDSHMPLSFTKDMFKEALDIWHQNFVENMQHRFRSNEDISIWLIRYYQLEKGFFEPRKINFGQFYELNNLIGVERDLKREIHALICINDTIVDNYLKASASLNEMLLVKFNEKSKFEL